MKICFDPEKIVNGNYALVINFDPSSNNYWIDLWENGPEKKCIWSNSTGDNPPLPRGVTME